MIGRSISDDIVEAVLSDGELGPNTARCRLAVPSLARLESDDESLTCDSDWSPIEAFGEPAAALETDSVIPDLSFNSFSHLKSLGLSRFGQPLT